MRLKKKHQQIGAIKNSEIVWFREKLRNVSSFWISLVYFNIKLISQSVNAEITVQVKNDCGFNTKENIAFKIYENGRTQNF